MQERNYTVYKHTSPSRKVYIGITCQKPENRWKNGKGYYHNAHFNNAIKKYGWENFTHEVLFTNLTKEEACQKEIELIDFYKSNEHDFGYNIQQGGSLGFKGCHHSEETLKKISERLKGKQSWLGLHHSEESKKKMSEAKIGKEPWNKGKDTLQKNSRKVVCIETGIIYNSLSDAFKKTKCYHIFEVCNGYRKKAGGYTWRFLDER